LTTKPILQDHHKAVFFDAGGTLLKPYPSVGDIYSTIARKYGCYAEPSHINHIFYQAWNDRNGLAAMQAGVSEKQEKLWWYELVKEVFDVVGPVESFDDFFEELYVSFAGEGTWKVFDEVLDVVSSLKKQNRYIAIISNWDSRLLNLCKNLELDKYFDAIHVSALVGFAKPDPRIFQKALDEAGVTPEEAIHVGDSLEDDYYGAREAGITPLFLDRDMACDYEGITRISSLSEIIS